MEVSGRKVEILCEPCGDNGQKLLAVGFCVDCCEFLCCLCYQHHCRARAYRDHVLQDEKTMPRTKEDFPTTKLFDNGDKCLKHQSEIIRFYCRADSQFGCGSCMTVNHRKGDEIIGIEEEYEKFDKEIKDFSLQLDKTSQTKDQNSIEIEKHHSQAVKDIKLLMKDIKEYFENLENKIVSDVDKVKDEDKKKMDSISATFTTLRNDLQSMTSDLSKLHKTQQNGKLFTMMEEARNQMKVIAKDINELNNENKVLKYTFVSEKIIEDLIGNVATLGKLDFVGEPNPNAKTQILKSSDEINTTLHETGNTSTDSVYKTLIQTKSTAITRTVTNQATAKPEVTSYDTSKSRQATSFENYTENNDTTGRSSTEPPEINNQTTPVMPKQSTNLALSSTGNPSSSATRVMTDIKPYPFKPRQISKVSKILVKSSTDEKTPWITGIALLSDDQLVLVDSDNFKLKLFNTKQNTLVSELKLSVNPLDITVGNNNQVAMTIPYDNKIQLLSVSNRTLSLAQFIKVKGHCQGIVHNNGTFIVTYVHPAKLEMLSMNGNVLKVIEKGPNGKLLFVEPCYIAISPDNTHVYIADMINCSVTCLTLAGQVKGVYKVESGCPYGLTVDKSGSVYVLRKGYSTSFIYQLSSDCSQGQELQGCIPDCSLQTITYCHKEDKLYAGYKNSYHLAVHQLK